MVEAPHDHPESGATSTEYVFLAVLIALAVAAGAAVFGGALDTAFTSSSNTVQTHVGSN